MLKKKEGMILYTLCLYDISLMHPYFVAGYVNLDLEMQNLTKYSGETVRIKCEITGFPLPRYRWFRDGQAVEDIAKEDDRYDIKTMLWGSRYGNHL